MNIAYYDLLYQRQNELSKEEQFFNHIQSLSDQDLSQIGEQGRFKEYFISNAKKVENMNWKELVAKLTKMDGECFDGFSCKDIANEIQSFRGTFMKFITKTACVSNDGSCETSCLSSGSDDLSSDVDVTVKGNCMMTNLYLLTAIRRYLTEYFYFTPFNRNIAKISKFFDVNFYLSDFAILKNSNTSDEQKTKLESYYLTNDQQSQIEKILKNTTSHPKVVDNFNDYVKVVENANRHLEILQKNQDNQQLQNNFVNEISNIALYEDECYVSQGAFMHVVYMTQKKFPFHKTLNETKTKPIFLNFMICSILENLNFAISHGGKSRGKYLMRVFDAEYHRRQLNIRPDNISLILDEHFLKEYNGEYILNTTAMIQKLRYSKKDKEMLNQLENSIKEYLMECSKEIITKTYNQMIKQFSSYNARGGRSGYRKLLDKTNKVVKKDINGKSCVVYVDQDRCQYVKRSNQYVRLQEARKPVSKNVSNKATKRPQHKKPSNK